MRTLHQMDTKPEEEEEEEMEMVGRIGVRQVVGILGMGLML